jgi:hypothetical protein
MEVRFPFQTRSVASMSIADRVCFLGTTGKTGSSPKKAAFRRRFFARDAPASPFFKPLLE